jgi:hypothetical protein
LARKCAKPKTDCRSSARFPGLDGAVKSFWT